MKNKDLERQATELLRSVWRHRTKLAPEYGDDPFRLLDPAVAARYLGFKFVEEIELRSFARHDSKTEVAGLIDRQARKIALSQRFPLATRRFTAGHEVGHALLHPGEVMHRDRPLIGMSLGSPRDAIERDADYFSACLLVPTKLLEELFRGRFGATPLKLDERSAFLLQPGSANQLLEDGLREFAFALSGAIYYANSRFNSLAAVFGVSVATMAYRLEETGLISE